MEELLDLREYARFRDFAEAGGAGPRFPTTATLRHFTNKYRSVLIEQGVLIPGKGSAPTLIRKDFAKVAASILVREARAAQGV